MFVYKRRVVRDTRTSSPGRKRGLFWFSTCLLLQKDALVSIILLGLLCVYLHLTRMSTCNESLTGTMIAYSSYKCLYVVIPSPLLLINCYTEGPELINTQTAGF